MNTSVSHSLRWTSRLYLIDNFLLLSVLLPQAGDFPPQRLVLTAREEKAIRTPQRPPRSLSGGANKARGKLENGSGGFAGISSRRLIYSLLGLRVKLCSLTLLCRHLSFRGSGNGSDSHVGSNAEPPPARASSPHLLRAITVPLWKGPW